MKRKANTCRLLILSFFYFIFLQPSFVLLALDPDKAITQYSLHIWNMEGGLPGNSVFAIQQTRDGYIWIGTQDGLVHFDGRRFEVYSKKEIPQLKCNIIRALYEDRNGILWIGTSTGGLTQYKEGQFTTYPVSTYHALYEISAINQDQWGNLWIGSSSKGLTCLNNGEFVTYTTNEGLPHNQVRSIYKDGNGDLWAAATRGIVKVLKPGVFRIYASQKNIPHYMTCCLYEEDTGTLWIGTGDSGLCRVRNGELTTYGPDRGMPYPTVTYLYRDSRKNLWIGTDGGGLTRMKNGAFRTLSRNEGLASGSVYPIYEDREGSLWIGTLDGGLHQLRDSKFTAYTTKQGLLHDYIHCIHKGRADHLWIGSKGGLNLLTLKNGTLTTRMTTREPLLENTISCIFEDSSGELWVGTWGGLHIFKEGTVTFLTDKDGLSDNRITYIFKDKRANTWIGTVNGLNRINDENGNFSIFTKDEGLLSNGIELIYEDSRGNLWIGTDAGLNRFNNGVITIYDVGGRPGNNHIKCVYEDNEGVLWFGTESGLVRLKEKQAALQTYNTQCGLVENHVYSILEDEKGYLWLAGRNGISRIRKKELKDFSNGKIAHLRPDSYNEKDGMKSRWCTGAGCKAPDGKFWFPTAVGVTTVDPNHIKTDTPPPPVIIEKIVVDGESINVNKKVKEPLVLDPGKKRLEFYYTSISFINPEKIKFKLKLKGYDKNWIPTGTARSTIYTGLPPGHHTLNVTACNPGGVWNPRGASFSFYLKPHFYQTVWFYLLAAFFIIAAAVSLYRLRVGQLKARERKLSALVEVRTRDLKERTDELEKTHYKLRESKEIIEEKNRHIMDSMRYARKIQQAVMPMKEKMAKELQDFFVIYRPKDIVSGDFYWFEAIADQYFLAAADCTGHGIPGALLSMIGGMMLHEVVYERQIFDPALALSHLHRGFRRILKQEREELDIYTDDGMDVGLCRIDLKANKIIFAGARHSLYYVKNSKFTEIKGNRKSIGGRQKEERRLFTNHEIDVGNEIMIYLTSDGFAHQPNSLNQKYGSRRLKKFLQSHAHLSAVEQQEFLLEELERHQGNEEQRDDITILGLRLRRAKI
jgi:ligand-binding sensor domain-containing protein/serine phosphatase RsbU (regulator of sigma subunit)